MTTIETTQKSDCDRNYKQKPVREQILKARAISREKLLKGYLRYKITSQNVLCEAQIKNFLFRGKIMFRSQDIQVFVFLII